MRRLAAMAILFGSLLATHGAASSEPTRAADIIERLESANRWRDHVMVVAHRGGGMAGDRTAHPENSRAAVEASIALGAEMVELDIQRSADGVLIVMHDTWLDRTTTCRGIVKERTLAQLRLCRLVIAGSGIVTAEVVPTLQEMFALTRGRILVNIDNKLALPDVADMVALARRAGVADQIVVKQNVWNAEKLGETRAFADTLGSDVHFMPILADDAVGDTHFMETVTSAFSADAAELIAWRGDAVTGTGGVLFSTRARAVAARGDWHLWVNTFAIVNQADGMLCGGRGDALAMQRPDEAYGFWAERGATIIQTDEPEAAIAWLAANGYRVPYGPTSPTQ